MEKLISATEARRKFLRILKQVEKGKAYLVTWYGRPAMRILPIGKKLGDSPDVPPFRTSREMNRYPAINGRRGSKAKRLGFMAGRISVPKDFDHMGRNAIERIFTGQSNPRNRPMRAETGGGKTQRRL